MLIHNEIDSKSPHCIKKTLILKYSIDFVQDDGNIDKIN